MNKLFYLCCVVSLQIHTVHAQRWINIGMDGGLSGIYTVDASLHKLYLHTQSGMLYSSTDNGRTAKRFIYLPLQLQYSIDGFWASDGYFFIATNSNNGQDCWRTSDDGATWTKLTDPGISRGEKFPQYSNGRGEIYSQYSRSTDFGLTWRPIWIEGNTTPRITDLIFTNDPSIMYSLDAEYGYPMRTTDSGTTWHQIMNRVPTFPDRYRRLYKSPLDEKVLFLIGYFGKVTKDCIFRSTDGGDSWELSGTNWLDNGEGIYKSCVVFADSSKIFLTVGGFWTPWASFYVSYDLGKSWRFKRDSLEFVYLWKDAKTLFGIDSKRRIIAATTDDGTSWNHIFHPKADLGVPTFIDSSTLLSLYNDWYISSDRGHTWSEFSIPSLPIRGAGKIFSLHTNPPVIFANGARSIDGGKTWTTWQNDKRYTLGSILAVHPAQDSILFVTGKRNSDQKNFILSTKDAGTLYDTTSFPTLTRLVISKSNPDVMVGTYQYSWMWHHDRHQIDATSDGGVSWFSPKILGFTATHDSSQSAPKFDTPRISETQFISINPSSGNEFYHHKKYDEYNTNSYDTHFEFFVTSKNGVNGPWSSLKGITMPGTPINDMIYSSTGDTIFVLISSGLRLSLDHGNTWKHINISFGNGNIAVDWERHFIYASSRENGVLTSTDFGITWQTMNQGFYTNRVSSVHLDWMGNLFASADDGIYKWEAFVDIKNEEIIPLSNNLCQNYPNPFSDRTTIRFAITDFDSQITERNNASLSEIGNPKSRRSESSTVTSLKVFDLLGREIATLIDGEIEVGEHTIEFEVNKLSKGLYFYRLTTQNYSETKMMIIH